MPCNRPLKVRLVCSGLVSATPGESRPRNSSQQKLAMLGRAKKKDAQDGGDKVKAVTGDHPRVRIIRPGNQHPMGTAITFEEGVAKLDKHQQAELERLGEEIRGKPQKIEIRGHSTQRPLSTQRGYKKNWELAFQRCQNTMRFLVHQVNIDARRVRVSVAGPHEPLTIEPDEKHLNPRVEVFLLDETVGDLAGSRAEQARRFADGVGETESANAPTTKSQG